MSEDPYGKVKGGRLTFKGGVLATRTKSIDKKNKNKKKKKKLPEEEAEATEFPSEEAVVDGEDKDKAVGEGGGEIYYTIDAAKRMKYDELFPVEAKKFGYDPKNSATSNSNSNSISVEKALDDRVKKKADRYCK